MTNVDGGFIIIALAIAAALLLGSCAVYESAEVFVDPYQGCGCGCDSSCCP